MSTQKINQLLKKKKWTGSEVGKALISMLVYDHRYKQDPNTKAPLTISDFEKLRDGLFNGRNDYEISVYRKYSACYSGLVDVFNYWQATYQQINHGFYRILMYLNMALVAEDAKAISEEYPLILTEEKYNELKAIAEREQREYRDSFISLLFHGLTYLSNGYYESKPESQPKELLEILEAYKSKPIKDKELIALFMETYDQSYYIFEDGTRSDDIGEDAMQEKIRKRFRAEYLDPIFNGEDEDITASKLFKTAKLYSLKAQKKQATLDEERLAEEIMHFLKIGHYASYDEFLEHNEPLTAFDVVAGEYSGLLEDYNGSCADTEKEIRDQYKKFKKLFPELAGYMESLIKSFDIPAFKNITPAKMAKRLVTWGELADAGVFNYDYFILPDDDAIMNYYERGDEDTNRHGVKRARYNGIAIIKPDQYTKAKIDEYGEFKEPNGLFASLHGDIETTYNDGYSNHVLHFCYENLLAVSLKFYYYYQAVIEVLAKMLETPELLELAPSHDMQFMHGQLESVSGMALYLESRIHYADDERTESVKQMIRELFPPIDLDRYKPTETAIERIKEELGADNANKHLNDLAVYITSLISDDDTLKSERGLADE